MSYMEHYITSASPIAELSLREIDAVFGGDTVPKSVPAGSCPPGYVVSKANYDANGNLVSYVCIPAKTTKQVNEISAAISGAIEYVKEGTNWIAHQL